MELLRDLADSGCTIICTTHVMENVYLMDQLVVMFRGWLVFSGSPQEARDYFGVQRLTALYDKLDENPPATWADAIGTARRGSQRPIQNPKSKVENLRPADPAAETVCDSAFRFEKLRDPAGRASCDRRTRRLGKRRCLARAFLRVCGDALVRLQQRGAGDREGNSDLPPRADCRRRTPRLPREQIHFSRRDHDVAGGDFVSGFAAFRGRTRRLGRMAVHWVCWASRSHRSASARRSRRSRAASCRPCSSCRSF